MGDKSAEEVVFTVACTPRRDVKLKEVVAAAPPLALVLCLMLVSARLCALSRDETRRERF